MQNDAAEGKMLDVRKVMPAQEGVQEPLDGEWLTGRASVYENLTVLRDEYRRIPHFI